jgi:co-chaperonin GroES (HSP10)
MLRPLSGYVLLSIEDEGERVTGSGLVLPPQASIARQQPRLGRVVRLGLPFPWDAKRGSWTRRVYCVEPGEWVIWDRAAEHRPIEEDGQRCVLVSEDRLLAVVPEGTVLFGGD